MATWWLVTWTTYGSWLPGDPRGFRTWRGRQYVPPPKRYAAPGEPTYDPRPHASRHRSIAEQTEMVQLTSEQQQIAMTALIGDMAVLPVTPACVAIDAQHVHLLTEFGRLNIRNTVARLKSVITRALGGRLQSVKRFWATGCHMRSLPDDAAYRNALHYVCRHREQGAMVHVWPQACGSAADERRG
jgi:hypothetical protein